MKLLLLGLLCIGALVSCGRDEFAVWTEDLQCSITVYPVWQRDCKSEHLLCTTWRDGKVSCLITMSKKELKEKAK